MKKILAVYDGTKYSDSASKYAIEIAKATGSLLVGVFIQDLRYLNLAYATAWDQPLIDFTSLDTAQKEDIEKTKLNMALFRDACSKKGVHHKVHLDKGVPLQEVLRESIFADILIIDSHTGFYTVGETNPSPFLKDLLVDSHCPVLIVPHHYSYFDKAILCYDGSASSIHAIKMFAYLFPELKDLETVVVSVNESSSNHLKESINFKDLAKAHFNEVEYVMLNGEPETELAKYLKANGENALVVMGAYGRNALSRMMQHSMANRVIKDLNLPVFIAHL